TAMPDLSSPVENLYYCYSAAENVVVDLTNVSQDSIDFAVDSAFINVNVIGAITSSYADTIINNNIYGTKLPSFETINIPIGNLDMSTPGTYYFDITIDVGNDTNAYNYVFKDTIVVSAPSGGLITGLDTICTGDTIA